MTNVQERTYFQRDGLIWNSCFKPNEKLVLHCLNSFVGSDGKCFPSQSTISKMTSFSRQSIISILFQLEEQGVVTSQDQTRTNGSTTVKEYKVDWDTLEFLNGPRPKGRTPIEAISKKCKTGGCQAALQGGACKVSLQGVSSSFTGGVKKLDTHNCSTLTTHNELSIDINVSDETETKHPVDSTSKASQGGVVNESTNKKLINKTFSKADPTTGQEYSQVKLHAPGETHKTQIETKKKKKIVSGYKYKEVFYDLEDYREATKVLIEVYNQDKPSKWPEAKKVTDDRIKMTIRMIVDMGDDYLLMLQRAMLGAKRDKFWSKIAFKFDNLYRPQGTDGSNGDKITPLAESVAEEDVYSTEKVNEASNDPNSYQAICDRMMKALKPLAS